MGFKPSEKIKILIFSFYNRQAEIKAEENALILARNSFIGER